MSEERFPQLERRCTRCGQELMPVVLLDGEIVDECTSCGVQTVWTDLQRPATP